MRLKKAAIAAAKARDGDVAEEDLRIEAHLNQRPGREAGVGHDARPPPLGEYQFPVVGEFPFAYPQPQFLAGQDGAGQPAAEHIEHFDRFNHLLEEAHQQHDRVRGMLEEHQQQLHRLHPFLPAPDVRPLAHPVRLRQAANPPFLHVHHYRQHANTRPVPAGAPVPQPLDVFNIGAANNGLVNQVEDFVQRELRQVFQRDFGLNNHNHHNNQFQLDGDVIPIQIRQNLFNHGVNQPMRPGQLHDNPNPQGNHFARAQQQEQQVQGNLPNLPLGH